ncbi:unnamed protein product [Spirodela intermedia]|uniref:AtTam37 zinc finger domain-containing protein n=1 Tax=Spirodela intermedia TaxID=51605 RepID=A0A7I8KI96_SPIIN|nr:unnamed protein product [Spirodela intermedia]
MTKGTDRLVQQVKQFVDVRIKVLQSRYGHVAIDLLELPLKVILSPFTLPFDIAGSAPRGFGIPKLVSDLSFGAIFAVATIGTYDIALELGKKVLSQRNCQTCNGWQALRCSMCKGSGKVHYRVKGYSLKSGQKPTAEHIAEAIAENRAELLHLPSAIDPSLPLPSKDCPKCDGSGVMSCPKCKHQLQVRISADDIMEPPWKAYNVLKKMDYPYENILNSMKDPKIAAFWLLTMPQVVGGFNYDDEVKQKIWWAYKESMRYDRLRDVVSQRKPGWEHLQSVLTSIDPARARDDPAIIRNVPHYKAKKALEAEVMRLDVPPRPQNWGELDLPINASSWTREELEDPKKLLEMTSLLSAQREMADKILDAQWEAKWRQDKLNDLLEEKMRPYIQSMDDVLPQSVIIQSNTVENKRKPRRRWWLF